MGSERGRLVSASLLLAVGLGLGCGETGKLNTDALIRGTVTDAELGIPLEGVRVQTMPPTEVAVTAADGTYTISAQLGVRYQVRAELDGFAVGSQPFTPMAGRDEPLDFALELVRVCNADARRCVRGASTESFEVCGPRGNVWIRTPCAEGEGCDDADGTCRAQRNLLVILDAPGGVIRSQPVDGQPDKIINCGTQCSADFFAGTTVTLVATPLARSTFTRWRGEMCAGSEPTCVVDLSTDQRVGGGFSASAFGLTVRTIGGGEGRVTSAPEGIDCGDTCTAVYNRDTMVTLTAVPAEGSIFARWEQGCSDAGAGPTCTLTMDDNKDARARFVPQGIPVEVVKAGTGAGTVTSMPAGIDCGANCLATFQDGTDITLTASAAAGSTFTGWAGACTGAALTCPLTVDSPQQVTATFDGIARTVIVELGGTGGGQVTSSPAGIDCGATCTASFANGAQVELTATPDASSVFSGWSLDCAAAGQTPRCALVLDADRRARAEFVPFYLAPLVEDGACAFALHMDAAAPDAVACGAAPGTAVVLGSYGSTASRVAALAEARQSQGADEEGSIDVGRPMPPPSTATLELTLRKDGPAYDARGQAALLSDQDRLDPATTGVRLAVFDDGRLVVSTRDATGATATATAAAGTIGNGTWYHVAATVDPAAGLGLFVDGMEVTRTAGPVPWTASSSTAWVGAEREGPGGAIHRFNGAMDEVRVSNVVRY